MNRSSADEVVCVSLLVAIPYAELGKFRSGLESTPQDLRGTILKVGMEAVVFVEKR
jgi:hypothetical protein